MTRHLFAACLLAGAIALAGCGGGGVPTVSPVPGPPTGGASQTLEVGPMLVRPASTGGFKAESVGNPTGDCAFVALHGAQIDYLASQALLDRIVFASDRDGYYDIWVCDLDGGNPIQITNNGAAEKAPEWSRDGTRIAFERRWPAQDSEIMTMNADGSTIRSVTNNADDDCAPTWSPDGRRLAYHSFQTCQYFIRAAFEDGTGEVTLASAVGNNMNPDWSPLGSDPDILFSSNRTGNYEIYRMEADGSDETAVITHSDDDDRPTWRHDGCRIAWVRHSGFDTEVFVAGTSGSNVERFSNSPGTDSMPDYSTDGKWICFFSTRSGNPDLWLQQTEHPFQVFQVTTSPDVDQFPDLGSPTMQTERVLIGPPGSDWGGLDPVWASAYAGIVAFDDEGYRNFVRIGVHTADLGSLDITPLVQPASAPSGPELVGVLIEANEIINLREDAGRGYDPTVWNLDPLDAGAALLYFSASTGKLVSVLAVDDSAYPSSAGSAADTIRCRTEGDGLVVDGRFAGVFDSKGHNVAPGGASCVALDGNGNAVALQ